MALPLAIALTTLFVLFLGLFTAVLGYVLGRVRNLSPPVRLSVLFPAAWVGVEWIRGWFFTGFPWLAFGYAHVDSAYAGWAPVAGVYGVSFAVVLSTAALLAALACQGRQRQIAAGLLVAPWLLGLLLGFADWSEDQGKPLRVTILQAGIGQDQKWLPQNRISTMQYYRDNTRINGDSDLVIWPEVAVPSLTSREPGFIAQLQADAREARHNILFGILEDENVRGERKVYNSLIMLDGAGQQVYRKRHLVPFGEYFPVPDKVREWMRMLSLPHSDISKGPSLPSLLETLDGIKMAAMICYEDAYGAEQAYAFPEAALIINVSNDAWFGDSVAPHQHLQISRMRSLEFGRPTVRSTNTGISAFIDHRGQVSRQGPQFREASLTASVQPRSGSTPYASAGNLPVLGFSLLLLGFFWYRARH